MNRLLWPLVDMMSGLLDPDERAVVLGDFAEAGTGPLQALHETVGLVLRRQAAAWKHWGPWVALTGIVIPLGTLLSHVSRYAADGTAITAFISVSHWTWGDVDSVGAHRDLMNVLVSGASHHIQDLMVSSARPTILDLSYLCHSLSCGPRPTWSRQRPGIDIEDRGVLTDAE